MGLKSTRLSLGLGLLLSLLVASTAFTASQLANKGVDAVYSQCFLHYLLSAFVYGGIMIHRGQPFLMANLGSKCVLTVVDIIAKALMIKAYKYTSLTSVMLLGCWTIPCVMVLSWLFLKTKCGFQKLVGLAICIAGLVAFVLFDVHSANRSSGINPLKGDLLIIIGATLYGVTNVCEEIFLKGSDHVEIMTFHGSYGAVLIGYQIVFNEWSKFMSILFSPGTMLLVIGFSLAIFLFYPGFLLLLKISGLRMLNVSLLTSIMWAVLIQIFVYHEKVDWIYFVCFAAVTLGLIVCSGRDEIDPNNGEPATIKLNMPIFKGFLQFRSAHSPSIQQLRDPMITTANPMDPPETQPLIAGNSPTGQPTSSALIEILIEMRKQSQAIIQNLENVRQKARANARNKPSVTGQSSSSLDVAIIEIKQQLEEISQKLDSMLVPPTKYPIEIRV